MTSPHRSKVAGFTRAISPPPQTPSPDASRAAEPPAGDGADADATHAARSAAGPVEQFAAAQERLASWVTDLTVLHELTERLARTAVLDDALRETLRAGAGLVGARRGLLALEPADGGGAERTVGLGLCRADIGQLETVPRSSSSYARLLDGLPAPAARTGEARPEAVPADAAPPAAAQAPAHPQAPAHAPARPPAGQAADRAPDGALDRALDRVLDRVPDRDLVEITHRDIAADDTLDPRDREVAARLGYAASYATPLTTGTAPRLGAAVWLYDEPAEPTARQRHLLSLYLRCAAEHIARHLELAAARAEVTALREGLLPSRLPRVPGVALARRHRSGPRGGGDWYDVLPLPEGAVGLTVGGVTGSGPGAVAAMGRLRASLRAYAVMEGEDPVAVLSDLELLLRLTEPARSATALFAYAEPAARRVLLAGAGHCPPLVVGPRRTEYVETTLSAPLGMLACWEAPSVELTLQADETLLLYSDGLLHRTGEEMDRAFARLHAAAAGAPPAVRRDPDALVDHVLYTALPDGRADQRDHPEDVVLLAARF